MNTLQTTMPPWSFTIVFDEEKAAQNRYDPDILYDYVGRNVEPLGIVRIGRGSWHAKDDGGKVMAQCAALSRLARMKWGMQNVRSWTAYEDDEPEGHDYLQVLREVSPHLICTDQKE